MAVMGVWAVILRTRHRWHKAKEQKNHENIPSRCSLNRKQRSLLFYIICVQYMKFWLEFGTINSWTNCQFIWSGKVYIWLSVWEFKKLCLWRPCLNNLVHVDRELKYWSPWTLLLCGHFIQIHSCMSICFSCMYTNNYKHFHKWFGIFLLW